MRRDRANVTKVLPVQPKPVRDGKRRPVSVLVVHAVKAVHYQGGAQVLGDCQSGSTVRFEQSGTLRLSKPVHHALRRAQIKYTLSLAITPSHSTANDISNSDQSIHSTQTKRLTVIMKFTGIALAAIFFSGSALAKPYLGNNVGITKRVCRLVRNLMMKLALTFSSEPHPAGRPISFVWLRPGRRNLRYQQPLRLQLCDSPWWCRLQL